LADRGAVGVVDPPAEGGVGEARGDEGQVFRVEGEALREGRERDEVEEGLGGDARADEAEDAKGRCDERVRVGSRGARQAEARAGVVVEDGLDEGVPAIAVSGEDGDIAGLEGRVAIEEVEEGIAEGLDLAMVATACVHGERAIGIRCWLSERLSAEEFALDAGEKGRLGRRGEVGVVEGVRCERVIERVSEVAERASQRMRARRGASEEEKNVEFVVVAEVEDGVDEAWREGVVAKDDEALDRETARVRRGSCWKGGDQAAPQGGLPGSLVVAARIPGGDELGAVHRVARKRFGEAARELEAWSGEGARWRGMGGEPGRDRRSVEVRQEGRDGKEEAVGGPRGVVRPVELA
jgi:hypothetical protein